jgi:serine/threonine protein kinase
VKAILKGLGPLHNLNYIHRDIKPENIILAPLVSSGQGSSPQKKTTDVNPD